MIREAKVRDEKRNGEKRNVTRVEAEVRSRLATHWGELVSAGQRCRMTGHSLGEGNANPPIGMCEEDGQLKLWIYRMTLLAVFSRWYEQSLRNDGSS